MTPKAKRPHTGAVILGLVEVARIELASEALHSQAYMLSRVIVLSSRNR